MNWNECRFEPDKFTPTSINHAEKRVTRDRTMSDDASIKYVGKNKAELGRDDDEETSAQFRHSLRNYRNCHPMNHGRDIAHVESIRYCDTVILRHKRKNQRDNNYNNHNFS